MRVGLIADVDSAVLVDNGITEGYTDESEELALDRLLTMTGWD
jgi:hypothetical protein